MAEKGQLGQLGGISDCSYQEPQRIGPNKDNYWHMSFFTFSMGTFLCITSSLVMTIAIVNFSLIYQTRNLLLETRSNESTLSSEPFPLLSSTYFDRSTTSSLPEDTDTPTVPVIPPDVNNTNFPSSTVAFTDPATTPTTTTDNPTNPKRPPDALLNELSGIPKAATYNCFQICEAPSIILAELDLKLSSVGSSTLHLDAKVVVDPEDKRIAIAKRKVAYLALQYLYRDNVTYSKTDPEWEIPPPECNEPIRTEWAGCKPLWNSTTTLAG